MLAERLSAHHEFSVTTENPQWLAAVGLFVQGALRGLSSFSKVPHSLAEKTTQFAHALPSLSLNLPWQKRPEIWQSQSYLDRLQGGWTREHLNLAIKQEVATFLQEYAAFPFKKQFPYGPGGVLNAYPEPMSKSGHRWVQSRRLEKKSTHRAELDTAAMEYFEQWLETAPVGASLVLISPRDTQANGYHGTARKNYVFLNHYTKLSETEATFTQFMSFDTNEQLVQLQQKLATEYGGQPHTTATHTTAASRFSRPEDTILTTALAFNPNSLGANPATLEQLALEHESEWPIRLADLPQLDTNLFETQVTRITDFCLTEANTLLENAPENFSEHYTTLIIIIKEVMSKWVEDHAVNYAALKSANKPANRPKTTSESLGNLIPPYDIPLDLIKERWQLEVADQLSAQDKRALKDLTNAFKLSPLTPLSRLASIGHCVVGTPLSLANAQSLLQNPSVLANLQPGMMLSRDQIAQFVGAEEAAEWHPGTCVSCDNQAMVGPCEVCANCDDRFPNAALAQHSLEALQTKTLERVPSGQEKVEAEQLFTQIRQAIFVHSASIDNFLTNDYTKEELADSNHPLHTITRRLVCSAHPLTELRAIVAELQKTDVSQLPVATPSF